MRRHIKPWNGSTTSTKYRRDEIQKNMASECLMDNNITRIWKAVEHWVYMVQEPRRKMQERWEECEKSWEKINQEMRDIDLPEFGPPEDFTDLHDIVKRHAEQDRVCETKISQVSSMILGQLKKFMEPLIKSLTVLQHVSVKLIKYKEQTVEIKEVLSALMDQHRFPYANTCEDLFCRWSNMRGTIHFSKMTR
jgi:hypothetical protein